MGNERTKCTHQVGHFGICTQQQPVSFAEYFILVFIPGKQIRCESDK